MSISHALNCAFDEFLMYLCDHTAYNANLTQSVRNVDPTDAGIEYEVGPKFFRSFKNWPGLQWTYQVPLPFGTLENAVDLAKQGLDAIQKHNLYALEIGNEPKNGPFKSPQDYVDQWLNYSMTIVKKIDGLPSGPIYQALSLGSNVTQPWNVYVY